MAVAAALPARAGMQIVGPACGTLLCAGRNDFRQAVADLTDGAGGWYLVTYDRMTDPVNPPDGGIDIGLIHLGPDLRPVRINDGPGGDDPCGALLVGGAGTQEPVDALGLGNDRYVVSGQEIGFDTTYPKRVFAWGFDGAAAPTWTDPFVSPMPFDVFTWHPRIAPDGSGGFYIAWEFVPPPPATFLDIYLARYDDQGRAVWPAPVRMTPATTAWSIESIAADLSGGVWVSWLDKPPGAPIIRPQHYLQHTRADGTTTLPAGGVLLDPTRDTDSTPQSALLGVPGGVLAATAFKASAVLHFVGDDGRRPWGAAGREIASLRISSPRGIRMLRAPDGSFRLLWVEWISPGDTLSVVRFEIDGSAPWPSAVNLLDGGISFYGIDVAFFPDGTLVALAGADTGPFSNSGVDLRAQAIDGRGRLKTRAGGGTVCGLAPSHQLAPRLLQGDDRTARFFWSDGRTGYGPSGAYNYFTGAVTFTSNPSLLPVVAPADLPQGGTGTLVLAGDDLDPAAVASPGEGLQVVSAELTPADPRGPGDRLTLTVRADPGAGVGTRALVLTNPDGESAAVAGYVRITLDARRIDIDGSGRTDGFDLAVLASAFGRARGDAAYRPGADIDGSGVVDGVDLALLASRFGGAPL